MVVMTDCVEDLAHGGLSFILVVVETLTACYRLSLKWWFIIHPGGCILVVVERLTACFRAESQMAPYSLHSALISLWVLVKSSALYLDIV